MANETKGTKGAQLAVESIPPKGGRGTAALEGSAVDAVAAAIRAHDSGKLPAGSGVRYEHDARTLFTIAEANTAYRELRRAADAAAFSASIAVRGGTKADRVKGSQARVWGVWVGYKA